MDGAPGQYGWLSEEFEELHNYNINNHYITSQLPRNSTSTFSSEHSSAASSVFSNSARYSQALSVASSQTSYSSSSARSAYSGVSTYSAGTTGSIPPNGSRTWIRPSPREKKATNAYACSHCNETFSKRADRKKHILEKCPYLGSGSLCSLCLHIGRNKHQVDKHQRSARHRGPCTPVDAKDKHAFTCSNDGKIYRSLDEYINHFSSERCQLNRAGANRLHRSRLRTLLSEGRDDVNGHSYIYVAFVEYCHRKGLLLVFNNLIDSLSEDAAQEYAERLEWGCMPDDGSAQSRLGYTSFKVMVDEIMSCAGRHSINNAQPTVADASPAVTIPQHQPASPRRLIPKQFYPIAKPLPNTPAELESAAVSEASAMLREDLVLRTRPEHHNAFEASSRQPATGYSLKRPRSLATSQQQEATVRVKSVNTQPSPVRRGEFPSELEEDLDAFVDWPEQYSLTPPLTARNLSFATRAQMEIPSTRTNSEKRHAGIWEWSFDDFVLFEQDD